MSSDIVPSAMNPELMPKVLVTDDYYVGNQHFVQQQVAVQAEIREQIASMEPWQAEAAKLYAKGKPNLQIAKTISKRRKSVDDLVHFQPFLHLVHLYQSLDLYMDGPNEQMRRQMLWEIAVDNKSIDPKESIKALAEMNKMVAAKNGNGGLGDTVVIKINNASFQRGNLDG